MNRKHYATYSIAVCLLLHGCTTEPSQPPPGGAKLNHSIASASKDDRQPAAAAESEVRPLPLGHSWDVFMLQGQRIGYGHTTIRRVAGEKDDSIRTENVSRLSLLRGGDKTEQELSTASLETPQGELISFQSEMRMGPGIIRSSGKVVGEKLVVDMTGPGETEPTRLSLPWSHDCLGPFANVQSLLRRPMMPGERRSFKTIVPGFNQIGEMTLAAKDFEPVALLDGTRQLLRIETETRLPDGQTVKIVVWCDRSGETLKSFSETMSMETFRVTEAEATRLSDAAEFDLMPSMLVKIERPLDNPHQTKRVRYRVRLEGSDPAESFAVGPAQSIEPIDSRTAEITVYAIRPGEKEGNSDAPDDKPTDADLAPNHFIQSDDGLIRANAEKAAGGESDPWRAAVALERFVRDEVSDKNYTQAFATAAEVARSGEGDCTEHAVYLAALCRARGIPARMAIGLVYMEPFQAFGFHAWTEVYVDGRWTPIDATLARGGAGAAHLKIASSNLKEASVYNLLLPVMKLIGGLRIEVVESS
ncbi:MAG: hypothetical protein GX594_06125 [Pirellulaceae bacterium]|nr:hypothetical protein [Pirellulaceae bacterium]